MYVSLLLSKNATGLGRRKSCTFPACNQPFSMQHVQGPWQRGWNYFCKASSTWGHPVVGKCRGARLWGPPACRQGSPTLDQHQFSHSDPQLHALVSGADSGNNNLSGAHIKQDTINAGNSPVRMWGVVTEDREVCTSPVLVKRVRQSMVPALPQLRNRWRRQQLETLAFTVCLLSHHLWGFGGKNCKEESPKRIWWGKELWGAWLLLTLSIHSLGKGSYPPTRYPHPLQPCFKYSNQRKTRLWC